MVDQLKRQKHQAKAKVNSKVEYIFRIMKRQFGFDRVGYRGLATNSNRMFAFFVLVNLYIRRKRLVTLGRSVPEALEIRVLHKKQSKLKRIPSL